MSNKLVSSGSVKLVDQSYYYEIWSDNSDIQIRVFHKGKKGPFSEFIRGRNSLKTEMEDVLRKDKVIN